MSDLVQDLEEMAKVFQHWIDFNTKNREVDGLPSDNDTLVMTPPHWPSHRQLKLFIQTLEEAKAKIIKLS